MNAAIPEKSAVEKNPRTIAREFVVQFLYQCESEKLMHFSESHFTQFVQHFQVPSQVVAMARELARGTLEKLPEIDAKIQAVAVNWKISRMSVVDRTVLRLASYELLESETPSKVVLNEAIELAKKYGAEESSKFVNGLLDKIAHTIR